MSGGTDALGTTGTWSGDGTLAFMAEEDRDWTPGDVAWSTVEINNLYGKAVDMTGSSAMIGNDLLLIDGKLNYAGTIDNHARVAGDVVVGSESSAFDGGTAVIELVGDEALQTITVIDGTFTDHLTINKTGGVATLGSNLTVPGDFTITKGAFNAGTWNMDVGGETTIEGGASVTAESGTFDSTDPVTIADGGTLSGGGTFNADITVASGGIVSPGNSPGTMTVNGLFEWEGGSTYYWEIDNVAGTAGQQWDLILQASGTFDITDPAVGNELTIEITGLGVPTGFDTTEDYEWMIVDYTAGELALPGGGFDPDAFAFDVASGFSGYTGTFGIANYTDYQGGGTNGIFLTYQGGPPGPAQVPEPATMIGFGLSILFGAWRLKKRKIRAPLKTKDRR